MVETSRYADGAAYLYGRYVPIAEACIPVTDWGFTRSDAVYDVVHVRDWGFFRLQDHLDRSGLDWQAGIAAHLDEPAKPTCARAEDTRKTLRRGLIDRTDLDEFIESRKVREGKTGRRGAGQRTASC